LTSTYGKLLEFMFYCCFLFTVPATSKNVESLDSCGCVCLRDVTILRLSVGINGGYNFNNSFPESRTAEIKIEYDGKWGGEVFAGEIFPMLLVQVNYGMGLF
jgi:hypothetical protein